ncbi:MAG: hypothetical protein ACPGSB_01875, partial [Opitutales bacterium]
GCDKQVKDSNGATRLSASFFRQINKEFSARTLGPQEIQSDNCYPCPFVGRGPQKAVGMTTVSQYKRRILVFGIVEGMPYLKVVFTD